MLQGLYRYFAPRAHTILLFSSLIFTLGAKLYQSFRCGLVGAFFTWIPADLSFFLGVELAMTLICLRWSRPWVMRCCNLLAALATTWAVINAGFVVRHGTQALPATIYPLIRDPLNCLPIVGVNITKYPLAALMLLGPTLVMLAMVARVVARPVRCCYSRRLTRGRIVVTGLLLCLTLPVTAGLHGQRPSQPASAGLQYNSHCKAIGSLIHPDANPLHREDFLKATRRVPAPTEVDLPRIAASRPRNLVVVVLEGIQFRHTSLDASTPDRTPFLRRLAAEGVCFPQMRSVLTHTTKALFSLLTGRYPSASQDVVEAIPVPGGYASLASILSRQAGYRTAFLQSAKGNFESRPGLVRNLGFETFLAREDLGDPNAFIGYLAADEFAMLPRIGAWLGQDAEPFFLTVLCSVSHDPYTVPTWFAEPAREPLERYDQVVRYTDRYIEALDAKLGALGLRDNTLFCVVGDHGEAFGEHGKLGHDRIGFEEALRVPWVMRGGDVTPGTRVTAPVSSIDVTPTLLSRLGFHPEAGNFDGLDVLGPVPPERRIFFSGWASEGAAGYVQGVRKVIHNPSIGETVAYDLARDPRELAPLEMPDGASAAGILADWRRASLFRSAHPERGRILLYDRWLCRWTARSPVTKLQL